MGIHPLQLSGPTARLQHPHCSQLLGSKRWAFFYPKSFSRRRSIARVGAGILRGACILPQLPRWHLAEGENGLFCFISCLLLACENKSARAFNTPGASVQRAVLVAKQQQQKWRVPSGRDRPGLQGSALRWDPTVCGGLPGTVSSCHGCGACSQALCSARKSDLGTQEPHQCAWLWFSNPNTSPSP